MVSPPVAEHALTIKELLGHTVQLMAPFPGHVTPAGHGRAQLVDPGADQVFAGQKSWEMKVGHWYPPLQIVQL